MGSALVRCNGNLRQVIRYDATNNMNEKTDQARARVADMHVDLRHGSTEEERGTEGVPPPRGSGRESRHSFTCECEVFTEKGFSIIILDSSLEPYFFLLHILLH